MATYDIRPLQLRILDILMAVDKVCKEHNLRYYIIAGTLLGAVRHKGFIPWDDDLDIGMPRTDYDLLMAHAAEWLPAPFEAACFENDTTYPLPFAKIQDGSLNSRQCNTITECTMRFPRTCPANLFKFRI